MLEIKRTQLPLAPAFAMTAHACQGAALPTAIVDMQSGRGNYVALTRTETREDLLIYRPFDLELFTQGETEGPELLLKTLRGEDIDWAGIEAKHTPSHMCTGCGLRCVKEAFQMSQWARKDAVHYCKGCVRAKTLAGAPLECIAGCGQWKPPAAFTEIQQRQTIYRICINCEERGTCKECGMSKAAPESTAGELSK